jgi:hypothetical protein
VNELVSNAVNGSDVNRPRGIRFQLGSKPGDVIVHSSRDRIRFDAPDFIQQFVPRDDFSGATAEQTEDCKFLACHFNRLSAAPGDIPKEIDFDISKAQIIR